ncbi:cysteine dioxygenase [Nocardia otitidiscaviarum]|uniref:Cysteine dioxygenase type I n=1 Tax=Nocardia otitidiscaviarum TaxID=1823 RepID=A0A378YGN9_9NOCA|nr:MULTISPECIES: cysteine dioxygenase [Nocardia]MBF6134264.1 cysteine dioxygenase [Nocardia otitidiscaviarum]MBF6179155.1 cysteine dioxygenase [Nocardia otitidiscaviarum]MBF6484073.1 cysteine dioxygenase [Nocardia otitidiscaviarum]SUA75587.1 Cysteine dioxygenase type I [Nocardia otitidiscaviarum]
MRSSALSLSNSAVRTRTEALLPEVTERATASALPTRLRPADLLRLTDEGAEDVLAGRYDHLLPENGLWPTENRWAVRLLADDEVDVWLISWVAEKSTRLHDHAGSLGALTVLSGALAEFRWNGSDLRRRILTAGDQASFPLGWVHDVVRADDAEAGDVGPLNPTLSVHAYSPPLSAMSYYDVTGHGTLKRTHTVLTDQPEGELE